MNKTVKMTLAAVCLAATSTQASAITLLGDDVSFTFDETQLGLFGPYSGVLPLNPQVIGNSLILFPDNFRAESLNGAGAISASDAINITVQAITPGFEITSVALAESGDYLTNGTGASVSASMRIEATSLTSFCGFPITCNDSTITDLAGTFGDTGGVTTNWSGSATVDLGDTAGWGSDTQLNVNLQNNLIATTLANGETAWIQKKLGGVGLVVNPIPVPAAIWLFGSGLLGLAATARRKRNS